MTDDIVDKIDLSYQPVNKLAVKVVFGEKIQFVPKKTFRNIYKTKPSCLSERDIQEKAHQSGYRIGSRVSNKFIKGMLSLVGKQFERLTVVGLAKTREEEIQPKALIKFSQKYKTFKDAFASSGDFKNNRKHNAKNRTGTRLYVCRCTCGNFCKFKKKSLEEGNVTRCDECNYLEKLRNGK